MPGDMTGEGGKCFYTHQKKEAFNLGQCLVNSDPTLKCVWPAVGLRVFIKR